MFLLRGRHPDLDAGVVSQGVPLCSTLPSGVMRRYHKIPNATSKVLEDDGGCLMVHCPGPHKLGVNGLCQIIRLL